MRAQVFHGPGDLRFEELPVPEPEPGEIVVRIEAALTCGTDVKTLRRGHPVMIPHVPTVFGHEFAGTVTRGGARASPTVSEGDRVVAANSAPCGACRSAAAGRPNLCEDLLFVNGAYGEYIALPPRLVARNVVPIWARRCPPDAPPSPSRWPARCWGSSGPASRPGMTVAVLGHGPLGCLLGPGRRAARGAGASSWASRAGGSTGSASLGHRATCLDAGAVPDMVGSPAEADRAAAAPTSPWTRPAGRRSGSRP